MKFTVARRQTHRVSRAAVLQVRNPSPSSGESYKPDHPDAATSVQAAPVPTNPYQHHKWHETPAHNVRKSQQYDHLVATNSSFRAYRMRKECGPIRDAELRASCVGSFNEYEPR